MLPHRDRAGKPRLLISLFTIVILTLAQTGVQWFDSLCFSYDFSMSFVVVFYFQSFSFVAFVTVRPPWYLGPETEREDEEIELDDTAPLPLLIGIGVTLFLGIDLMNQCWSY